MPKMKRMPVRVVSRRSKAPVPVSGGGSSPRAREAATVFGLPAPPPDHAQKPAGITLCMIVKNEERFLAQCLESVKDFVDEICIVDTGSSDRTIEIARSYGAKIEEHAWRNDFGWARDRALAMATRRWIFQLDADEELLPESHEALRLLRDVPAHHVGVWVRCNNAAHDYAGTGSMSHALVRIFPNDAQLRYRGAVHEFVSIDDNPIGIKAVSSPIAILHHGYLAEIVAERDKARRNLDIIKAQLEREPEDPFHWFNLGMTAYLMRDDALSREGFEKMRELNGDVARGFIPNGLATLADLYSERLHEPEKGRSIAEQCLSFSPHYANAHFALGKALVALGRLEEARAAFLSAIDDGKYRHLQFVVDDEVPIWKAHSEIGATYVVSGDDEKAIEWFDKGLVNRPSVQALRLNKARALERLKRFDQAGAILESVWEEFGNEQATLHYVNFLLRHGGEKRAVEVVELAHERLPKRTAVSMLVAAAAVAQKNGWSDPHRYLERAVAVDPGAAEALNPLEAHYLETGDTAALAALLEGEARSEPVTTDDFLRRAYRSIATDAFAEGLAFAERGLALAPKDAKLQYNAAVCSVNLGKREEALAHLDAVDAAAAGVFVRARYLQAVVLRDLGRAEEALDATRAGLAADGDQPDTIVLQAGLLEGLGRPSEAEAVLRNALPGGDRFAVELASFYLRAGRVDDARAVAERALG
jgi:tetratricopeptide (TPR) repeat protein